MSECVRIQLLGEFHAVGPDGKPVEGASGRLQELLAFLVLHRDARQSRHRIAFLFWPDSPEPQALTNLRQLVHALRRAFPEPGALVEIRRGTLRWAPSAQVQVDVVELEEALDRSQEAFEAGEMEAAIRWGRMAATRYRGDVLPACYAPWIESFRRELRERIGAGLEMLATVLESRREYSEAVRWARRLVELDPLREAAHRTLIRLQALAGEPAAALRSYRDLARTLAQELEVEPAPETRVLVDRLLRDGARRTEPSEEVEGRPPAVTGPPRGGRFAEPGDRTLVGRHPEWAHLCEAWKGASVGGPGLVLIGGEAGIGKSHLAEAFAAMVARQGVAVARARCWEAEGPLPFSPLAQWLRAPGIAERVEDMDPAWRAEVARVVPELAGPPGDGEGEGPSRGPAEPWRRLRLFQGLARAMLAEREPLLLVLDDLQWCDGESLEWIHFLLRFDPSAPLLLLATLRSGEPGMAPRFEPWLLGLRQLPRVDRIELERLGPQETAELAGAVGGRELAAGEAVALHRESEGNPLFVCEMLRLQGDRAGGADLGETGVIAPGAATLPGRVRWMIRSRLERLSEPARDLLPLLAAVGRDFTVEVLREASPNNPEGVVPALEELVRRRVVRERSDGSLDFAHDKIREVAYGEVTSVSRAFLHQRVARALERVHASSPDGVAARVARHLELAGRHDEAIPWRERAARGALELHAYAEAVESLGRALAALRMQPESRERLERELELQTALGVPLVALDHYSGDRVWRVYRRAAELCRELGRPASPPVLRALALAGLMRSRLPEVVGLGRQLMEAAHRDDDPMLRVEAHYVLGVVHYWQGQMEVSREHLERALELYRPGRFRRHVALFAQDPAVVCGVRLALTEWHLGQTEAARRRCLAALERARELNHPLSLAYARCFGSWVLIECGDLASARRETGALVREASEHGVAVWSTWGGIPEGYLLAEAGHVEEGIRRIGAAMGRFAERELTLGYPYHQGLLARALVLAGRPDEAVSALDEGLAMAKRSGQRFWDGELLRMRDVVQGGK
jgi:DNA-binding SARP family transcriptional activator